MRRPAWRPEFLGPHARVRLPRRWALILIEDHGQVLAGPEVDAELVYPDGLPPDCFPSFGSAFPFPIPMVLNPNVSFLRRDPEADVFDVQFAPGPRRRSRGRRHALANLPEDPDAQEREGYLVCQPSAAVPEGWAELAVHSVPPPGVPQLVGRADPSPLRVTIRVDEGLVSIRRLDGWETLPAAWRLRTDDSVERLIGPAAQADDVFPDGLPTGWRIVRGAGGRELMVLPVRDDEAWGSRDRPATPYRAPGRPAPAVLAAIDRPRRVIRSTRLHREMIDFMKSVMAVQTRRARPAGTRR